MLSVPPCRLLLKGFGGGVGVKGGAQATQNSFVVLKDGLKACFYTNCRGFFIIIFALLEHSFMVVVFFFFCQCVYGNVTDQNQRPKLVWRGRGRGRGRAKSQLVCVSFFFLLVNGERSDEKQTNGVFETTHKTEFWATCLCTKSPFWKTKWYANKRQDLL